jgi:hypothetical protein
MGALTHTRNSLGPRVGDGVAGASSVEAAVLVGLLGCSVLGGFAESPVQATKARPIATAIMKYEIRAVLYMT